ncbi:hypothetical protein [Anaerovorax odorimutans]|uniref:hypothetical protein n=1 Tax=Anaerovorax odorimutans TaxID=109327 RepID=UPI00040DBF50|nr:hypothetical protein [Anaerovorax odorimutans]
MKKNKKGFITVEAAIFIPVFIIGLLTLAYLIKILWIQESNFFIFEKEAHELSKNTYVAEVYKNSNKFLNSSFELLIKNKIYKNKPKDVQKVNLSNYKYLYKYKGVSGLISAQLNYNIKIRMPIQFYNNIPISDKLLFRAFIGADENLDPMSFEEMEKFNKSEIVWVFPKAGKRYHKENCSYISNKPKQVILNSAIRKKYKSCDLCNADEIADGNIVYCFTNTGKVYHSGNCPLVKKYVIPMEKEEAIAKGYTPCHKCGGE